MFSLPDSNQCCASGGEGALSGHGDHNQWILLASWEPMEGPSRTGSLRALKPHTLLTSGEVRSDKSCMGHTLRQGSPSTPRYSCHLCQPRQRLSGSYFPFIHPQGRPLYGPPESNHAKETRRDRRLVLSPLPWGTCSLLTSRNGDVLTPVTRFCLVVLLRNCAIHLSP